MNLVDIVVNDESDRIVVSLEYENGITLNVVSPQLSTGKVKYKPKKNKHKRKNNISALPIKLQKRITNTK